MGFKIGGDAINGGGVCKSSKKNRAPLNDTSLTLASPVGGQSNPPKVFLFEYQFVRFKIISPVTPWGTRGAIFKSKFDPNFQFWNYYIEKTVKKITIFIRIPEHVLWWVVTEFCRFMALLYILGCPNDPQIPQIVIFGLFLTILTPLHMVHLYFYYCFWKNSSIRSFWAITQPCNMFWGVTVTIFVDFCQISPKNTKFRQISPKSVIFRFVCLKTAKMWPICYIKWKNSPIRSFWAIICSSKSISKVIEAF